MTGSSFLAEVTFTFNLYLHIFTIHSTVITVEFEQKIAGWM